ncbi:MAG: restriction endonuclease subunit S [bacterium]|nr:restriction endonuclease subunit S [bacterium]
MKYNPYPKYKDSGIEWIGSVPEGWETIAVWLLFSIGRGRVISNEEIGEHPGEYPVYSSQTEDNGVLGYIDSYEFEGDYLTWTTDGANAGTVFKRSGKFCCTNVCGTLLPKREISLSFFQYAIDRATSWHVRHDINPKLMNNVMASIRVQFPSLPEQRAIAAFLDRETGRIDELIGKKERQIELLQEKRQALISHAVTKGLDPKAKLKDSGIEWLGMVPEGWAVKKVKYLVRFVSGGTPSTTTDRYWGGDIPWVSPKDMKVRVVVDAEDHITTDAVRESATTMVPKGSALMVVRSGILAHTIPIAIAGRDVAINQDLKALVARQSQFDSDFLVWYVEGKQDELLTQWRKHGATVQSLEQEFIANYMLPVPPINEQRAIAQFLFQQAEYFDKFAGKIRSSIGTLREYRTALISAAVTGKIDVRGEV